MHSAARGCRVGENTVEDATVVPNDEIAFLPVVAVSKVWLCRPINESCE